VSSRVIRLSRYRKRATAAASRRQDAERLVHYFEGMTAALMRGRAAAIKPIDELNERRIVTKTRKIKGRTSGDMPFTCGPMKSISDLMKAADQALYDAGRAVRSRAASPVP
jgi:hypothetical protein